MLGPEFCVDAHVQIKREKMDGIFGDDEIESKERASPKPIKWESLTREFRNSTPVSSWQIDNNHDEVMDSIEGEDAHSDMETNSDANANADSIEDDMLDPETSGPMTEASDHNQGTQTTAARSSTDALVEARREEFEGRRRQDRDTDSVAVDVLADPLAVLVGELVDTSQTPGLETDEDMAMDGDSKQRGQASADEDFDKNGHTIITGDTNQTADPEAEDCMVVDSHSHQTDQTIAHPAPSNGVSFHDAESEPVSDDRISVPLILNQDNGYDASDFNCNTAYEDPNHESCDDPYQGADAQDSNAGLGDWINTPMGDGPPITSYSELLESFPQFSNGDDSQTRCVNPSSLLIGSQTVEIDGANTQEGNVSSAGYNFATVNGDTPLDGNYSMVPDPYPGATVAMGSKTGFNAGPGAGCKTGLIDGYDAGYSAGYSAGVTAGCNAFISPQSCPGQFVINNTYVTQFNGWAITGAPGIDPSIMTNYPSHNSFMGYMPIPDLLLNEDMSQ